MGIRNYRDLEVWKKAMLLTNLVYKATQHFPKEEVFGLSTQTHRSAVSIPSNIAEGSVRGTKPEFSRFIGIARGSLAEIETQIMIAKDRKYITQNHYDEIMILTEDISKMRLGLLRSLKT